jgi:hypothetical protein
MYTAGFEDRTVSSETDSRERLIVVRDAGVKGRGVYALKAVETGDLLERAPGIYFDADDSIALKPTAVFDHLLANPADYAPGNPGNTYALINGGMSYCNHAADNNAVIQWSFEADGLWLQLRALAPIAAGAEVTIRYTNLEEYPDGDSFAS